MKIVDVKKISGSKFLSFYDILLENPDTKETSHYYFSSRHGDESQLECLTGKQNVDTVCIVPKFYDKDGDLCYVIIDEMRYPIGDVCYSFPAGLVDGDELKLSAALRELEEETGIKITDSLTPVGDVFYNSEGMTDETVQMFEAVMDNLNIGEQKLQDLEERIGLHFVKAKDVPEFMKGKKFSTKAGIYLTIDSQRELEKIRSDYMFDLYSDTNAQAGLYLNDSIESATRIFELEERVRELEEKNLELENKLKQQGGKNQPEQ